MLCRSLLLVATLCFKLAAQAQGLLLPPSLPGYGAQSWRRSVPALPGGVVAGPPTAPMPTVAAAAAYPPLNAPVHRFDQALPDNRLVYYRQSSSVATGASLVGAVAGWLLSADPRVQAYQQNRQFTGRYDTFSTPRQATPDDLLR